MNKRGSGILLHITSLFSPYGIGDMGPDAYRFADFLSEARQSFWQVLPLNPIGAVYGNSPYSSISAFAGEPLLVSPGLMIKDGFLAKEDVLDAPRFPEEKVDYDAVRAYKEKILNLAYQHFKTGKDDSEYKGFCAYNSYWLEDFALFIALKEYFGGRPWNEWPPEIRDRETCALEEIKTKLGERVNKEKFFQYLFFKQWFSLKRYCNARGIRIIGDIPIYVTFDSSDVWKTPGIFKLSEEKMCSFVAGVPPDYFSKTGQLWGNPVYKWDALKESGYKWWIQRMEHTLNLFDIARIDHFRGLVSYWEIPADEKTAVNGRWVKAPAEDFFSAILSRFSVLPIIAEDLGIITPDVKELMRHFNFPGMKVLLFAFGEDSPMHPYLPHTYNKNCAVYTGTHDNNTVKGWFEKEASSEEKERLFRYIGRKVSAKEAHWEFVRLAVMSVADTVIFPMQDIIGLGEEARMNTPATTKGNWQWRLAHGNLSPSLIRKIQGITITYGRTGHAR